MPSHYTITELAREFGVTTRAMRFYEDQGLLAPTRQGRSRIYSRRDRVRLRLTLRGRRLGLALGEIRELFELYDSARDAKPQLAQFQMILEKRRGFLERQRHDLDAMLAEISVFENQCRAILENMERGESHIGAN